MGRSGTPLPPGRCVDGRPPGSDYRARSTSGSAAGGSHCSRRIELLPYCLLSCDKAGRTREQRACDTTQQQHNTNSLAPLCANIGGTPAEKIIYRRYRRCLPVGTRFLCVLRLTAAGCCTHCSSDCFVEGGWRGIQGSGGPARQEEKKTGELGGAKVRNMIESPATIYISNARSSAFKSTTIQPSRPLQ